MAGRTASDRASDSQLRVLTLNLWGRGGDWASRRCVLQRGLRELSPDLIAFQEAFKQDEHDTVAEIVAGEYHVYHQTTGLLGDGQCAAIASRWPLQEVRELDQQLTPRAADFPAMTLLVEIEAPEPVGPLLFVNHLPSWKRSSSTSASCRRSRRGRDQEMIEGKPMHCVLAGDLDAVPESASIRFLRGLQSLGGLSVCYRDAGAARSLEIQGARSPCRTRS